MYYLSIRHTIFHSRGHRTRGWLNGGLFRAPPPTLQHNSHRIGASQSPSTHLNLDSISSISFPSQFHHFQHSSAAIENPESPLAGVLLLYFIPRFIPLFLHSWPWDESSFICNGTSWSGLLLLYSILQTLPPLPPFQWSNTTMGASQSATALCSLVLSLLLFNLRYLDTFCVLGSATLHVPSGCSSFPHSTPHLALCIPTHHSPSGVLHFLDVATHFHGTVWNGLSVMHVGSQPANISLHCC